MKIYDASHLFVPPMIGLQLGTNTDGLAQLEQEIARRLGVDADFDLGSGIYASELDAMKVKDALVEARPDLAKIVLVVAG